MLWRRNKRGRGPVGALGALLLLGASLALAAEVGPAPDGHVADRVGVLTAEASHELEQRLAELHDSRGVRVVVLTLATTEGVAIKDYCPDAAEQWGLNDAPRGGVLVALAVEDRKACLHATSRASGALPDDVRERLEREVFGPQFAAGDFAAGLREGTLALADRVNELIPLPKAPQADGLPAVPLSYVEDLANVVSAGTEQALNAYLHELDRKSGAQIVVLTIDSTGGEAVERYALRTFNTWRLGDAQKNNGVLVVIAVEDRRARIQTGAGIDDVLTDAMCVEIGKQVFAPAFKRGDYDGGVLEGTLVLANVLAEHEGVSVAGMPLKSPPSGGGIDIGAWLPTGFGWLWLIAPALPILWVLSRLGGYGEYRSHYGGSFFGWLWWEFSRPPRSSYGWGSGTDNSGFFGGSGFGGGSFGGGGGGFSGGGGGSFGW